MNIDFLSEPDRARWDEFVLAHENGTFFHLSGWKDVLETAFGHRTQFLFAEQAGEILGLLPLAEIKSVLFGHRLISLPFCVYGGPLATNRDVERSLIEKACQIARESKVDTLEVRWANESSYDWPTDDLYCTFRKSIDPDPEINLSKIPRKQRAMVRKGIKAGLRSRLDGGIDEFYDIFSTSVRNLGTPVFAKSYFHTLRNVFQDDCEVMTIDDGTQPIASVMSFKFRSEILPYYGGSQPIARAVKGNDFMYWEVMNHAAQAGFNVFDFGRSKKNTGSFAFKKNWGFEPTPLYYQHYLVGLDDIPQINPNNPRYQAAIKIWSHLPIGLTRLVGPLIARNLG